MTTALVVRVHIVETLLLGDRNTRMPPETPDLGQPHSTFVLAGCLNHFSSVVLARFYTGASLFHSGYNTNCWSTTGSNDDRGLSASESPSTCLTNSNLVVFQLTDHSPTSPYTPPRSKQRCGKAAAFLPPSSVCMVRPPSQYRKGPDLPYLSATVTLNVSTDEQ
jgi:hypothetical protein